MQRNIVICSDGTGNTFDKSVSNVTRLIKLLALNDSKKQIVVYDQGIGTNARRLEAVKDYKEHESIPDEGPLIILDGPKEWGFDPAACLGWLTRLRGLAFGYGFDANVREMYKILSQLYEGPDDKIYFFGFSRGAFTVRALAGLLYHCGLPGQNVENFEASFDEAYQLYYQLYEHRGDDLENLKKIEDISKRIEEESKWIEKDSKRIREDSKRIAAFRNKYSHVRNCKIHFLGIWDTVKSYGGVRPIILPHLRHNPHVKFVRHALALNERRPWFDATTWGQIDSDEQGAKKRLTRTLTAETVLKEGLNELKDQDIEEVWFRGCHSDIGGGDAEAVTGMIALRWMLGEAADKGILLNENGESMLTVEDPPGPAEIHESLWWPWRLAAYLRLWEIDNSGEYPVLKRPRLRTGRRNPDDFTRNGRISLHTSVGNLHSILVRVEHQPTKLRRIS